MKSITLLETFKNAHLKQKRLCVLSFLAISIVACQASNISFPNAKLVEGDQRITSIPALLTKPEGTGPFPAVVILTTCGGMKPHVTSHWPDFLTDLGYVALTVNSLGARGYDRCTRKNFMHKNYREITKDAYGALDFLASQPYVDRERIAVMGFSMGAAAINNELVPMRFREISGVDFKAAIASYGYCSSFREGSIPLMRILAEKDRLATACLTTASGNSLIEVHLLPGAYHAFDSRKGSGKTDLSGNYMKYDASATEKAKEFTKEFLGRHFGE